MRQKRNSEIQEWVRGATESQLIEKLRHLQAQSRKPASARDLATAISAELLRRAATK